MAGVQWGIELAVKKAQRPQPGPGSGPPGCLFVPNVVRSDVLEWGHASLSGHPVTRTLKRIQTHDSGGPICRRMSINSCQAVLYAPKIKNIRPSLKVLYPFRDVQGLKFTFTFMHLADAFIQSDLQCIQVMLFFFVSMCVPWELNPRTFALLTQCSWSIGITLFLCETNFLGLCYWTS